MQTIKNYINEAKETRKEYSFEYNDKVFYKGWFEEDDIQLFAQGAAMALRMTKAHPEIKVYEIDGENKKIVLNQR